MIDSERYLINETTPLTIGKYTEKEITYLLNENVKKAKGNAKRLTKILDNKKIKVIVSTTKEMCVDNCLVSGGAFMGNKLIDKSSIKTQQTINPEFFSHAEKKGNIKIGTLIMHEITESYEGGLISLNRQQEALKALSNSEKTGNEIYNMAHVRATTQPRIRQKAYDSKERLISENDLGRIYPSHIDYYVKGKLFLIYTPNRSRKQWK